VRRCGRGCGCDCRRRPYWRGRCGSQHLDPHTSGARTDQADGARRGIGEVDGAAVDEGPAVVDAYLDGTAVGEVRHHGARPERQRRVGGGQLELIVDLTVGGAVPVKARPVPGGDAELDPVDDRRRLGRAEERAAARHEERTYCPTPSPAPHPRASLWWPEARAQACGRQEVCPSALRIYSPTALSYHRLTTHRHSQSF